VLLWSLLVQLSSCCLYDLSQELHSRDGLPSSGLYNHPESAQLPFHIFSFPGLNLLLLLLPQRLLDDTLWSSSSFILLSQTSSFSCLISPALPPAILYSLSFLSMYSSSTLTQLGQPLKTPLVLLPPLTMLHILTQA
jgi:hypothetical protein